MPTAAPSTFGDVLVPHSRIRQIITKNMVQSAFTAPHVTTLWDVNMAAVIAHRTAHKKEFAAAGVNLTLTAYLVQAIVAGLKAVPAKPTPVGARKASSSGAARCGYGRGPAHGRIRPG